MSIVPRITCRRCGRQYSGLQSRCPYCGARKVSQSQRVPGATPEAVEDTPAARRGNVNTKWQMMFGGILLVAVLLAVIVLVSASLNGSVRATPTPDLPTFLATTAPPATPTATPSPTPTVESVGIYFYANAYTDVSMDSGSSLYLTASAYPFSVESKGHVNWTIDNEEIATISVDEEGGVTVTAVSNTNWAWTTLRAEIYGVTGECIIRIKAVEASPAP